MTIERKVFRGIGAMITSIDSERVFEVAPKMRLVDPTDYSREKRIRIDLDRTPSRAASWSDIQIDDRGVDSSGNFLGNATSVAQLPGYQVTSLGGYAGPGQPDDLARSPMVGRIYLEDSFFAAHRSKIDLPGNPWPIFDVNPCQLTTVAYSNAEINGARRGKRYVGFLGRLRSLPSPLAEIELFPLARQGRQPALTKLPQFDLSSADHVDPDPPYQPGEGDEPLLGPDSAIDAVGAIFVEIRYLARLVEAGLTGDVTKLPIGLGD